MNKVIFLFVVSVIITLIFLVFNQPVMSQLPSRTPEFTPYSHPTATIAPTWTPDIFNSPIQAIEYKIYLPEIEK